MALARVVLIDDQEEVRRTVISTLNGNFDVVGTGENGAQAVELATQLSPDALILDIAMPVSNGIEAARRLRELGSRVTIIFLTVHEDPDFVEAAFEAGGLAYVLKPFLATDLIPAISASLHGDPFVSASIHFN